MDRREFLRRGAFFTVAAATPALGLVACGDGTETPGLFQFPQGIASGDPRADSVVFWTRCARADGGTDDVALRLHVAADAHFTQVLADLPLTATATFDHTVRAKVTGLPAASTVYYRFVAGADLSPVGTAKTAAAPGTAVDQLRFGWLTCQDWSVNHWGAMSLLAQEDLDFLVHLGDYIYETVGASFQVGAVESAHAPITLPDGTALGTAVYATTLEDYRTLYRTYRADARLKQLHQQWALVAIWDDHEFSDDCWQDHQTYTNENKQQTDRRRAANQAWVEYMPVDFGDVAFDSASQAYDNLRIYRDFHFGDLVHLVMTDERLYRDDHVVPEAQIALAVGDDPVNGSDPIGSRYFVQAPVLAQFEALDTQALGRVPSILGPTQAQWWKDTMAGSTATWKIWGNEVTLNHMQADMTTLAPPPYNAVYVVNADSWDGYPSHRADLLAHLRANAVTNVVAITGDLHAFQCGVVRDVPVTGTPTLVDFVSAGVSSTSFYKSLQAGATGTPLAPLLATPQTFDGFLQMQNPDLKFVDHDAQGYATAVVTPASLEVTFHKVKPLEADGSVPADPLLSTTRITLAAGSTTPVIQPA